MYKVYNDNNVIKEMSDEDIEKAVIENNITYMVIQAMGQSKQEEYLKYILPFLEHEKFYVRRAAIQAVLNVSGKLGVKALRKKCEQYNLESANSRDKILLMVAIMLVEEGAGGLKRYFISEDGNSEVKDAILTFYDRGYQIEQSDIELICYYIREYIDQSFEWIKKMKRRDRNESIYFAFDGLVHAGENTNILNELSDELSEEICGLCEEVIEKMLGDNPTYAIAVVSQYMRKEYGIRILRALKDRVKGGAKSEFKKSLKKWNVDVEEL